jgi:hypothetical protein
MREWERINPKLDFKIQVTTLPLTMNSLSSLSPAQLRQAADIQERIQSLQAKLNRLLGEATLARAAYAPGRRKMSAAGRARIAAAARARWARLRKTRGGGKPSGKPKRKMSAAGRARLSALARARWQKVKAAGKKRL